MFVKKVFFWFTAYPQLPFCTLNFELYDVFKPFSLSL